MNDKKTVTIRLFFNSSVGKFYIQIGDCLCPIRDTIITAIKEREQLNIIQAESIKAMQEICNKE